jgi:epoxyqueuosine reductase
MTVSTASSGTRQSMTAELVSSDVMDMDTVSWETLQTLARKRGLCAIGVADTDLRQQHQTLQRWLDAGCHGDMDYMLRHSELRRDPAQIVPGCLRVITVRLDYLSDTHAAPENSPEPTPTAPPKSTHTSANTSAHTSATTAPSDWREQAWQHIHEPGTGYISLYARGRDYHKVLRQRLQGLSEDIANLIGPFGHRVFVDSGPVLEVALASKAGLGWQGKHTLLINREAGSMFFLGEILTDHPFEPTPPTSSHCGSCTACIDVCPTNAIRDGWVDARRCISYLTIEHKGAIPIEFRKATGNRIYGCDDCQLICPWNKFAKTSPLKDFDQRAALKPQSLCEFMNWTQDDFLRNTEGTAIRRIGHERWQRNVAVALGNGPASVQAIDALKKARVQASEMVREHIDWALEQMQGKAGAQAPDLRDITVPGNGNGINDWR